MPVEKVRAFEAEYLDTLRATQPPTSTSIRTSGKISDEATAAFKDAAERLADQYADDAMDFRRSRPLPKAPSCC